MTSESPVTQTIALFEKIKPLADGETSNEEILLLIQKIKEKFPTQFQTKVGIQAPVKTNFFPKAFNKKEIPLKFQGNYSVFVDMEGNFLTQKEANTSDKDIRVYDNHCNDKFEMRHQ